MLVDCSNCHTVLQLPEGAKSICCAICQTVTHIAHQSSLSLPLNSAPVAHAQKRAVICGVSYKNTNHELKGCINDAKCIKYLLLNKFNFPESSVVMLTGIFFYCLNPFQFYVRVQISLLKSSIGLQPH